MRGKTVAKCKGVQKAGTVSQSKTKLLHVDELICWGQLATAAAGRFTEDCACSSELEAWQTRAGGSACRKGDVWVEVYKPRLRCSTCQRAVEAVEAAIEP